ncbi:MAG TPA: hypothetical protein VEY95_06390 [Azospirillaceae bacterium]|nr:hypothetical protein [Azospirillaceae bacterium]
MVALDEWLAAFAVALTEDYLHERFTRPDKDYVAILQILFASPFMAAFILFILLSDQLGF